MIGQRVLPLDGLQAGYRHISLRTEGNFPLSLPTIFCHIVLKTYVPDGLGDIVKALNNPKEYLTREEKRLKQLQEKLGIDANEIVDVPAETGINNTHESSIVKKQSAINIKLTSNNSNNETAQATSTTAASIKKEETPIEKITRDELRKMKGFQKLLKKQHKEKEGLKKKHNKEKCLMQKHHSSAIDKLTTTYSKLSISVNNNVDCVHNLNHQNNNNNNNNTSNNSSRSSKRSHQENNNNDNINNDKDKISELVEEQTRAWVALVDRQQQEEKQLNNEHIDQQCNIFEQLLVEAQKQRKKLIDQRLNK